MSVNTDPLEIIDVDGSWGEMEKFLRAEWPRSIPAYCWIKTRMEWKTLEPAGNQFHVCCPGGDVKNGIVTFGKKGISSYYLTICTFNNDLSKLRDALLRTKNISWEDHSYCIVPAEHASWLEDILDTLGYRVTENLATHHYELPKEKALLYNTEIKLFVSLLNRLSLFSDIMQLFGPRLGPGLNRLPDCHPTRHNDLTDVRCPEDTYIAPLRQRDLARVNSLWSHGFEGSQKHLTDVLRLNFGCGLYSKRDDRLLSWAIKYEHGDIGLLQTEEEFKKKGYARLVTEVISRTMAERRDDIIACIVVGNTVSERLFLGMGFQYAASYNYIAYEK